mgnify:CR=1 FL=1
MPRLRRALSCAFGAALVRCLAVRIENRGHRRVHSEKERHHVAKARVRFKHADDRRALDLVEHVADVELDAHMRGVLFEVHSDEVHQDVEAALGRRAELLWLVETRQVAVEVHRDRAADDARLHIAHLDWARVRCMRRVSAISGTARAPTCIVHLA